MDIFEKHINEVSNEEWSFLYNEKKMTLTEIASIFGVCAKTISVRLEKAGISRRPAGREFLVDISKEELEDIYINKNTNIEGTARYFGTSHTAIRKHLVKYGIPLRENKTRVLTEIFLLEQYVDGNKSANTIAEEVGVSVAVVCKYLHLYGIELRGSTKIPVIREENENKIVSLYTEGVPSTKIAKMFDTSTTAIFRVLSKHGIISRGSNDYIKKVPSDNVIVDLYNSGFSIGEVAEQTNAHKGSVFKILKRNNVVFRSKSASKMGHHNNMMGVHHTASTRKKMSDVYVDKVRGISNSFGRGKNERIETPLQGVKVVRSSWEGAVARYFNAQKVKYLYEPTTFEIVVDDIPVSYTPDFLVLSGPGVEREFYLEVKGMWKEDARKKVNEAIKTGCPLEVWEKDKLVELGILTSSFKPLY